MNDPDLKLDGLSIWVDNRQFPEEGDYWDGNWLNIRAEMKATGSRVVCGGAILRTDDIRRFRDRLKTLFETVQGSALLDPLEPDLKITLEAQSLGHIAIRIEITPDHLQQSHVYLSGFDQSYLPALIAECDRILERFPVRGTAGE